MAGRKDQHGDSTRAVAAGRSKEWTGPVVNPPIWRASTHIYESEADRKAALSNNKDGQFYYGRRGAPTQWALAQALTELEPGAAGTVLYPSGVAAIAGALLAVLSPGDVLLLSDNSYEPSRSMGMGLLKRMGVETRFFDPLDLDAYRNLFCERTKCVWLEVPGSLTMEMCDVPELARIAREKGAICLIDNTWATSLGFPALQHGCDISVTSLTKHISGHSDLMMGAASAGEKLYRKLRITSQQLGQVVSPDDCALALRGLRTMPLRLERTMQSALQIADWLATREDVAHVLCPMRDGDAGYELWQRDFSGGCGLFSFVLKAQDEAARARLVDNLELFGIGYSWGGFESLALPFDVSRIRDAMAWPKPGWNSEDRLGVRLSIGLEDPADLIADLDRGFAAMRNP
ncbi:cystathionine beta-lyase [Altererythrobacter lutimaris]|uniref:Cystathionine beta-lyase n=1 Tax=Altererythrobacter lutimaris TaxID=2743979 RepID=A0A850HHP2_9SPHN|nr:cystathionine beta-lyase [Altererythrobacter lutimaris]NVE94672.1 cystathionine beta-lyase [Altererythrobacter lutimaris]